MLLFSLSGDEKEPEIFKCESQCLVCNKRARPHRGTCPASLWPSQSWLLGGEDRRRNYSGHSCVNCSGYSGPETAVVRSPGLFGQPTSFLAILAPPVKISSAWSFPACTVSQWMGSIVQPRRATGERLLQTSLEKDYVSVPRKRRVPSQGPLC